MNPWFGILFVLSMLGGLMSILRWYKQTYQPHPELVRKLLHIGMGLTTLTFPWLFQESWPILLLAGSTVFLLYGIREINFLKRHFAPVIHGVQRQTLSIGEICFPVGVAMLFIFSQGEPLQYCIPILLLTLADSAAALIGIHYGLNPYATLEGQKSLEGSIAFFIVALVCIYLPLVLFSSLGLIQILLIALTLSSLMMVVEAVALWGLDNLLIPTVGFALLSNLMTLSISVLLPCFSVSLLLVATVLIAGRLLLPQQESSLI